MSEAMAELGPEALAGVRVLDVGTVLAGPVGATFLGEFGAEVIKIELPGAGDSLRTSGPMHAGISFQWLTEARNKKAITLDMRKPEGQRIFRELVKASDLVFENFRPGTMERWGIGYEDLKAIKPELIMVRASGFGQTGPYRNRPGYDRVGMAMGGLTYVTGYPDQPPVRPGLALADYMTAMFGAMGALIALYYRDAKRSGQGQYIDVALFESIFRVTEFMIGAYDKTGWVRERIGNGHPTSAPGGTFTASDGKYITIACVGDKLFQRFARVIGRTDMIDDPRFRTGTDRMHNIDEIHRITQEWIGALSGDEALGILEEGEIPSAPLYSIVDIATDPHYAARGDILEVDDPRMGTVKMPMVTPKLSLTPGRVKSTGPDVGQHNDEVYGELLGLSATQIAELRQTQII